MLLKRRKVGQAIAVAWYPGCGFVVVRACLAYSGGVDAWQHQCSDVCRTPTQSPVRHTRGCLRDESENSREAFEMRTALGLKPPPRQLAKARQTSSFSSTSIARWSSEPPGMRGESSRAPSRRTWMGRRSFTSRVTRPSPSTTSRWCKWCGARRTMRRASRGPYCEDVPHHSGGR